MSIGFFIVVQIWFRLDEPQMLYLILEIEAPAEARQAPAPPLNVCLVLDRSTSMQGEKMDTVKSVSYTSAAQSQTAGHSKCCCIQ